MKIEKKYYFLIAIIFIGIIFLFFNDDGLIKYWKLDKQIKILNNKSAKIDSINKQIESEIDSLKRKIPAKIEKIAREKYNMKGKNENVIKVEEK